MINKAVLNELDEKRRAMRALNFGGKLVPPFCRIAYNDS